MEVPQPFHFGIKYGKLFRFYIGDYVWDVFTHPFSSVFVFVLTLK